MISAKRQLKSDHGKQVAHAGFTPRRVQTDDALLVRLFPNPEPMNLDGKRRTRASFEAQREPAGADRPAAVKEDSWLIFSYWRSSHDHDYCIGVPGRSRDAGRSGRARK